ncbi:MAG: 16S rRNA (cytosine(1402)-N(4))-methyltransferase RsmH [Bacteroidales bacterium]|nr:16S rRNA (cytosine(1402)-N(4))-methyltransferase RsmH [Bacteroidales bacterium]
MYHNPVMLNECIEGLNIRPDGVYVDLTFGGGGHSRKILENLNENGRLIAFDQDADAQANSLKDPRFLLVDQNFRYMLNFLRYHHAFPVDGILADLGISSHHIDEPDRGFATRFDGPLDMRMNRKQELTAATVINTYSEEKLKELFFTYGEISNSRQLAASIIQARTEPITTVERLRSVITPLIPGKIENKYLAQVFQSIRIEVNDELGALGIMLKQTPKALKVGGRLVVMSYHSLEDRLVKNFIRTGNLEGNLEKDFFGNTSTPLESVNRKAWVAGPEELKLNPRSRSAKLRIAIKIKDGNNA